MQTFFKVVTSYLQEKMALDNDLIKDLTCLHPNAKGQERSVRAIGRIARLLPHVVDDSQVSLVRDEWKAYQAETVPADWFLVEKMNGDTEYKRVDDYWNKVLTIKFSGVVKSALCIHHSNSDVKRSLSDNKNTVTQEGTSLSENKINLQVMFLM